MLRTWAVYERRRAVAVCLVVWTVVTWVPNMTSLGIFLDSLRCTSRRSATSDVSHCPADGPLPVAHLPGSGCHVTSGSPIVFVCWVLLTVFEAGKSQHHTRFVGQFTSDLATAILALMVVKAVKTCTSRASALRRRRAADRVHPCSQTASRRTPPCSKRSSATVRVPPVSEDPPGIIRDAEVHLPGSVFYLYLFALSTANVIVILTASVRAPPRLPAR